MAEHARKSADDIEEELIKIEAARADVASVGVHPKSRRFVRPAALVGGLLGFMLSSAPVRVILP